MEALTARLALWCPTALPNNDGDRATVGHVLACRRDPRGVTYSTVVLLPNSAVTPRTVQHHRCTPQHKGALALAATKHPKTITGLDGVSATGGASDP